MTTTANTTSSTIAANQVNTSQVANNFAYKFYSTLNKEPHNLFHFYKDTSVFTRGTEDSEVDDTVYGKENINKKIQSLNFQDCKVSLSVVDAQAGIDNGIVITVIGHLSNKGEAPKKFVQTFFLATQTEPVGYYVKNDIFRYLKDTSEDRGASRPTVHEEKPKDVASQQQPAPVAQRPVEQPTTETPKTVVAATPAATTPSVQPSSPTPAPTAQPVVVAAAAQQQQQSKPQPTTPSQPQQQHQAPTLTPAVQKQDEPKKAPPASEKPADKKTDKETTTAAVAENNIKPVEKKSDKKVTTADGEHAPEKKQSVAAPKEAKPSKGNPKPQQPVQPPQPAKPAIATWATIVSSPTGPAAPPPQVLLQQQQELARKTEEEKNRDPDTLPTASSVTVSNLPYTSSEDTVRATFAALGEVKTIIMKKGYCFIEFSSPDVAKSVVEKVAKNPIAMEGRTLNVDNKKKPNRNRTDANREKGDRPSKDSGNKPPKRTNLPQQQNNHHDSPKRERPQSNNNKSEKYSNDKTSNHQPKPKAAVTKQ